MDKKQLKNICFGKITDYDGMLGNIVTEKQSYMFFSRDVIGNLPAQTGDYVEFREETIKMKGEDTSIARFVFVKKKSNIYQMEHSYSNK